MIHPFAVPGSNGAPEWPCAFLYDTTLLPVLQTHTVRLRVHGTKKCHPPYLDGVWEMKVVRACGQGEWRCEIPHFQPGVIVKPVMNSAHVVMPLEYLQPCEAGPSRKVLVFNGQYKGLVGTVLRVDRQYFVVKPLQQGYPVFHVLMAYTVLLS